MYVDSHAHIEMHDFDEDRQAVIQRALDADVRVIVNVGDGDARGNSHSAAFRIAEQYSFVYTTAGVHPHEATLLDDGFYAHLEEMARHPKVIAVGEIGLDYHYDNSPRDVQRQAFRRQLRLARERDLPVVIHTREAEPDTLEILNEEWTGASRPGILHCFTGTRRFAESVVEMGFYISFSGVVTFKKAVDLREVAKSLPLERLLIETDSPFLAPEPFRGRRNEPSFVIETARRLAALREIGLLDFGRTTTENFMRAFNVRLDEA
ncbi:MAG TPA: TatD family hydrolase [Blastocatellia bacterium]